MSTGETEKDSEPRRSNLPVSASLVVSGASTRIQILCGGSSSPVARRMAPQEVLALISQLANMFPYMTKGILQM